jgi:putative membrane protein
MNLFLKWLLTTLAILITGYIIPGVEIAGFWAALWVAVFLGVFNVVLKPILILLTLPINILTLGLFTFVINALLALLISTIVEGFYIEGLLSAILFSIVLSVVSYALNQLITKTGNNDHRPRGQGGGRNSIEGEVVE